MKQSWYTVRIDRDKRERAEFRFQVAEFHGSERGEEMVAMDSTPAFIAIVRAESPGAAAARAWDKGVAHATSIAGGEPVTHYSDAADALLSSILPTEPGFCPGRAPKPNSCGGYEPSGSV